MATPAYMSITGTKQGLITAGAFTEDSVGNTYQEGHEDQVMVQGFNHEVIIPRDPQSGQPTGQRVHKPVVITKVFDATAAAPCSSISAPLWKRSMEKGAASGCGSLARVAAKTFPEPGVALKPPVPSRS
ncbi:secreted protein Hcp [Pseudomonas aeruginosa PA38182]|nr:secreted protein Hcp [Pseudomonas aeruginosa PA38182]